MNRDQKDKKYCCAEFARPGFEDPKNIRAVSKTTWRIEKYEWLFCPFCGKMIEYV